MGGCLHFNKGNVIPQACLSRSNISAIKGEHCVNFFNQPCMCVLTPEAKHGTILYVNEWIKYIFVFDLPYCMSDIFDLLKKGAMKSCGL